MSTGIACSPSLIIISFEPLIPEEWDPDKPPYIADYIYSVPYSMLGEYCDIHGPENVPEMVPLLDIEGNPILDSEGNPIYVPAPETDPEEENSNGNDSNDNITYNRGRKPKKNDRSSEDD